LLRRWVMTAIVFLVSFAGHLLGDWVAQTDWQAINKTRSWAALAAHVASYHLIVALLLLIPMVRDGWPAGKALAAHLLEPGPDHLPPAPAHQPRRGGHPCQPTPPAPPSRDLHPPARHRADPPPAPPALRAAVRSARVGAEQQDDRGQAVHDNHGSHHVAENRMGNRTSRT
jgi:hypothetical protein